MKPLWVLLLMSAAAASALEEESPGLQLSEAARNLMEFPMPKKKASDYHESAHLVSYEVEPPSHEDLAISRLQSKVSKTVNDLWQTLRDPQRYAIFTAKPGSVSKNVLTEFGQKLQGDIFAVDQLISEARTEVGLKRIALRQPDWMPDFNRLHKLVGKIDLLYGFLNDYMANPQRIADNSLEDYAMSIAEPGSSQETSVQTAMIQLHNMSIPHEGFGSFESGPFDTIQRQDVFYKLFLILNRKVQLKTKMPAVPTFPKPLKLDKVRIRFQVIQSPAKC